MKLILASKSPRRKEILSKIGADFEVRIPNVNEKYDISTPIYDIPKTLAERKAMKVDIFEDEIIVACDTVVICEHEIFGKPHTEENAIKTLERLSGKIHYVVSGLCVRGRDKIISESVETKITMRNIAKEEIERYVDKFAPLDKAGAYGIQDGGGVFVTGINGDYYNAVGLPLCRLCEILKNNFGFDLI